jgi:excisionase family DNA binding protein
MRARKISDESPLLVSIDQAAGRLSVGRTKIYELARKGKLQLVKIDRATRVVVASIETLIQEAVSDQQRSRPAK